MLTDVMVVPAVAAVLKRAREERAGYAARIVLAFEVLIRRAGRDHRHVFSAPVALRLDRAGAGDEHQWDGECLTALWRVAPLRRYDALTGVDAMFVRGNAIATDLSLRGSAIVAVATQRAVVVPCEKQHAMRDAAGVPQSRS